MKRRSVLAGLAVVETMMGDARFPRCDIAVLAIRGEENAWFGAQHVGSRALFGKLDAATMGAAMDVPLMIAVGAVPGPVPGQADSMLPPGATRSVPGPTLPVPRTPSRPLKSCVAPTPTASGRQAGKST